MIEQLSDAKNDMGRSYGPECLVDIVQSAMSKFGAGSASVMLPNLDGKLVISASYGITEAVTKNTCIDGTCEKGFGYKSACVYKTGEARLVETEEGCIVSYRSNSMCIPIRYEDVVIGVLNISNRSKGNCDENDIKEAINFAREHSEKIHDFYAEPQKRVYPAVEKLRVTAMSGQQV